MRASRFLLLGLLLLPAAVRAEAAKPASPLRMLPEQADFVVQVHEPRRLVETYTSLDIVKHLQQLEAVKELLDSTSYRRFYQLLAHFEKELGLGYEELLDKLAGGGMAVGSKYGDKSPALFVAQGTDASLVERFLKVAIEVVEQEVARQEAPIKPTRVKHQGVEIISLGNDLHAARVEAALLISNKGDLIRQGIDRALGSEKKSLATNPGLIEAAKLLPKGPLASIWLNIEPAKKNPAFEAFYKTPRDPFITVVLGGWASLLGQTPYLTGGFYVDPKGSLITFRVPRGSESMGADGPVYAPPKGEAASRPLLRPKDTLYTTSYHYDMARFWTDRVELFGPERAKDIEKFDKQSGILSTVGFSKLLTAVGPYQRLVAVHRTKGEYKKQPRTVVPSFAMVVELRKPEEFGKGMETLLRTAGLLTTPQFGLKMVEEKVHGHNMIAYRFDEKKPLEQDTEDFRFNFSPCFVKVGNQFLVASTMELGRELVAILNNESKSQEKGTDLNSRSVLSSATGKEAMRNFEDQIVAATILGQALPLDEAKAQVRKFLGLFDLVEELSSEEKYGPKEFHLDIRLKFKK